MSNENASTSAGLWQIRGLTIGACLLLSAGAWFGGIEPALAHREKVLTDRSEYDSRITKVNELAHSLQSTRRQLEQARQETASLPLKLEPASAVNQRLARIAELAGEAGLALDEVQPGTPTDGAYYQTVPLRLAGQGTYPATAAFLRGLRTRFPDMSVRSFDCIASGARKDKDTPASFRAEIAWFTRLPRN